MLTWAAVIRMGTVSMGNGFPADILQRKQMVHTADRLKK